jgi:hypothetical protein
LQQHISLGDEIMSYDASIHSYGYNSQMAADIACGISRERGWRSGAVADSAPSRLESDPQLAMDRLLREYLTRKSPWE